MSTRTLNGDQREVLKKYYGQLQVAQEAFFEALTLAGVDLKVEDVNLDTGVVTPKKKK